MISCNNNSTEGLDLTTIDNNVNEGAQAFLCHDEDSSLWMSWTAFLNDTTDALMISQYKNGDWNNPITISKGTDWFVNWADFPACIHFKNSDKVATHWLKKSDIGTYDYNIWLGILDIATGNIDSFILHDDINPAEHGFVSYSKYKDDIAVSWLDGRNTKSEINNAMTLRSAVISSNGQVKYTTEVDNRVCDCCQTSMTETSNGFIVAYRDRSEDENRHISIRSYQNEEWSKIKKIKDSDWTISGCPVNGPVIRSHKDSIYLAWYKMHDEAHVIRISASYDEGQNFNNTLTIDSTNNIGRLDMVIDKEDLYISWFQSISSDSIDLMITRVNRSILEVEKRISVARLPNDRATGFPKITIYDNKIFAAYTVSNQNLSTIQTLMIDKSSF